MGTFLMPTVHDGEGKLAFHKIKPLCKLEERHAVDLGSGYKMIVYGMHKLMFCYQ